MNDILFPHFKTLCCITTIADRSSTMPPAKNQALVPAADLPYFTGTTVVQLKARLTAAGLAFDAPGDSKYDLYYRLVAGGSMPANMVAAGHVPTPPPVPPGPRVPTTAWPAPPAPRELGCHSWMSIV